MKEAGGRSAARRVVVTASAASSESKNILMMGGTRFIGLFLARELIEAGHQVELEFVGRSAFLLILSHCIHLLHAGASFWQVTLFTRGKAPICQQLPGESDEEFADYSSKVSLKLIF